MSKKKKEIDLQEWKIDSLCGHCRKYGKCRAIEDDNIWCNWPGRNEPFEMENLDEIH